MISTKDIPGGGSKGLPKTLQPGNTKLTVRSIYIETPSFDKEARNVFLECEGPNLGPTFEGFFIDKKNEAAGRYGGQVGRIRAQQWTYLSKDLSTMQIDRDVEITKFLKNFAIATNCLDWFEGQDGKHETIESLITTMNNDGPFKEKVLNVCICGKEYLNKGGYIHHDLFFPKFHKTGIPFESSSSEASGRVYTFNENDHIIRIKKEKEVESFEVADTAKGGSDFEL